jgi:hypothetical protein
MIRKGPTLEDAREQLRRGTLLRVGDIIQCHAGEDLEQLVGPSVRGGAWPCVTYPIGWGAQHGVYLDNPTPFDHAVPADFAELAALCGRIVCAADAWSTWTEEAA